MNSPTRKLFAVLFSFILAPSAVAEPPRVAATISPIHSLALSLLAGTDSELELLVPATTSPHHFHMRPSNAETLENADVVFWISEHLEGSLAKPIAARVRPGAAVKLMAALDEHDLIAYDNDRDEHGHDDEHGAHDGHDEHEHGRDEHEHEDEHGHHDHGAFDPHVWLSPKLAADMAGAMAAALIRADAENAEAYRRNLLALRGRLSDLDAELRRMLSDLPPLRAFVYHDAYGYFQREYGLRVAGTILGAEAETHGGLSAARVAALREIAEEEDIRCIFAEPQFNPRTLTPITRGFEIKTLVLDPLGADIPPGADAYFEVMRNLAKGFAECAKT